DSLDLDGRPGDTAIENLATHADLDYELFTGPGGGRCGKKDLDPFGLGLSFHETRHDLIKARIADDSGAEGWRPLRIVLTPADVAHHLAVLGINKILDVFL